MSETDLELLARYTRHHAEDAFSEVVRRHLDLVHSAALRQVRSPQLAEEVAQSIFIKLAHQARQLAPDTILTAWLYQVTRRKSIDVVRREVRRQLREQIAVEMNAMNATATEWTQIEPLLDDAMHTLDDTDRTAVLLRYFEGKPAREMAQTLGISAEAAQKRVSRAVERLREFFAKRGVTVATRGLAVVISANAVQAAPVGLSVTISTAVALAGTTIVTSATATATKAIAMTATQKVLIAVTLAAAVGTGIYEARKASTLRNQVRVLEQQKTALTEQLTSDRDEATRQLAAARDNNIAELARLRGEVTRLRRDTQELARLNVNSAQATNKLLTEAQATPQTFENQGMATPEAGFQTFLWAARNGDSNLVAQMLRWRKEKEDAVSDELANKITTAQARGAFNTFSNLAGMRILGQKSDGPDTTRMRVEFSEDNGKMHLGEIYMVREGDEWRAALNFSRREGHTTVSAQFVMPTTPELGPVTPP